MLAKSPRSSRQRPPQRTESGSDGAPPARAASSPGEVLRAARLRRRISLAEAEQATHIRQQYLQALEDDEYSVLPPGVYSRGFLRNYAIFLGVPPEEVMAGLGDRRSRDRRSRDRRAGLRSVARPVRYRASGIIWAAGAVAGLALLVFLGLTWLGLTAPEPAGTATGNSPAPAATATSLVTLPPLAPAATATTAPAAAPTARPTAQPSAGRQLEVEAQVTDRSWIRATVDGRIVLEETVAAGQTLRWAGQERIELRVGNAGGVEVTVNGRRVGALGPAGQPVDREFTRDSTR